MHVLILIAYFYAAGHNPEIVTIVAPSAAACEAARAAFVAKSEELTTVRYAEAFCSSQGEKS